MVIAICSHFYHKLCDLQDKTGARLDVIKGNTVVKLSGLNEAVLRAKRTMEEWMEYNKGWG